MKKIMDIVYQIFNSADKPLTIPGVGSLSELGIRDVWKTRCALCAKVCFILEGMSISFQGESRENNLDFVFKYILQKPLKCTACNSYVCVKCAAKAAAQAPISGVISTPLGHVLSTACPFCIIPIREFA